MSNIVSKTYNAVKGWKIKRDVRKFVPEKYFEEDANPSTFRTCSYLIARLTLGTADLRALMNQYGEQWMYLPDSYKLKLINDVIRSKKVEGSKKHVI